METSVWKILKEEKWTVLLVIGLGVFWSIVDKSAMSIIGSMILIAIGIVVVIIYSIITQKIGVFWASILLLIIPGICTASMYIVVFYYTEFINIEFIPKNVITTILPLLTLLTTTVIVAMGMKYRGREQKIKGLNQ